MMMIIILLILKLKNSETKKANTIEDKYNNSINDSNNRMVSAIAIGFMLLMALMIA